MKTKSKPTLKSVKRRFNYWRSKREVRENIPEKLWGLAVKLTEDYSVNQISKELRLNFAKLQKQILKTQKIIPKKQIKAKSKFVELNLKNAFMPESDKTDYEIELTDNRGWKLKLRGASIGELIIPAERIWRGEIQ